MASLQKPKGSKYWVAFYRRWDAEAGEWKRAKCSTRCVDRDCAEEFLETLEAQCQLISKMQRHCPIAKQHFESLVSSLLSAAGIPNPADRKTPPLTDYIERHITQKARTASPATIKQYQTHLRSIEEFFQGKPRLGDITPARAQDYYTWLNKSVAPKTSADRFHFLRSVMEQAVNEELLDRNPCRAIQLAKPRGVLKRQPFTLQEARQIIDYLWESDEPDYRSWSLAASLALMAGARLTDCVTMLRSNIENGCLKYTQTKTGKTVTIPLVIDEYRKRLEAVTTEEICPNLAKRSRRGDTTLIKDFTKLVSEAGIKQAYSKDGMGRSLARKTFHSFRHTLRTAIVASNGSDAQADAILGHSSGQGKAYTHSEVSALEGVLSRALGVDDPSHPTDQTP